ncbi:SH3 domain-containing protein [Frigidibacter sp.]|uniref:SH3 domain-containing protein n=1 Tax=Frigidibacter sp. TaxID=2586418 RepID=UPI002735BEB1|nr:SH3 domain-containing protein [Frigidibacter sp.]MDP3339058.1 SH3 domain-containing protein [Frigidibacter sp.]
MTMRAGQEFLAIAAILAALFGPAGAAQAQDGTAVLQDAAVEPELDLDAAVEASVATADGRGPVTNLPMPRFVSMKASEGNARRGPSLSHRIDWVFRHRDMPLRVTAEFGHWRRVEDRDGAGGWVHYSLISGVRTVVVSAETADLRARDNAAAPVQARAMAGVIARLEQCGPDWCRINAGGQKGWVQKSALWGVDADELVE